MDGILNINKPTGKTSYAIVSLVKRLSLEKRVGHAGTLDPAASGVLPVCLGQGTRIVEYLMDSTKTYRAGIELGVTTDTYDAAGTVTARGDASSISREQFENALASFRGIIRQTPPMYSAVRHHGLKLYHLARAGVEVPRESRSAHIYRFEITAWEPPFVTVEVECGKGTYIRSLAHDLGQMLGCGASLQNLCRLRCGVFSIEDAVSLPDLEEACRGGYWRRLVHPIDTVLLQWPAVVVSADTEAAIRQGRPFVPPDASQTSDRCRAYNAAGVFLAVLRFESASGQWRPEKVFVQSE